MLRKFVAGQVRDVVFSETRDCGGMFDAEVGVWRGSQGFTAYVKDGFGGGINSGHHGSEQEARDDIERLWDKFYGS